MKYMSKVLMSTVLAFGLLSGSVGALGAENVSQSSVGIQSSTVHPVLELRVGETYQFAGKGFSAQLISGHGVISLDQYGKATALSPGDAVVHVHPKSGITQIRPIKVLP
ncbi:hypothetical protein [Paenibacillus agilis]|uniref:Uncharacterized protein n=1 Tax=Paenibacillus agilis TaxID=3020863 RepID=A0A559IGQ1_9BACL|nr:hypothetical protein [Paenibacillus agilis]TVX86849.1 hypothetical protein FPZ44_23325 [Paenibacillus agilis]